MSLDSSSTLAEIKAAYDDNLDYDTAASTTKAKAFVQAARMLLRRMAQEITHGGRGVVDDYRKIEGELAKAESWWRNNDSAATGSTPAETIKHVDFRSFRE